MFKSEKNMYEHEWHGIKFSELGTNLNYNVLPDARFYQKFYKELFLRYQTFDDLNKDWIIRKEKTAKTISDFITYPQNIFSYGCGIGYIEYLLAKFNKDSNIDGFDFSLNFKHFLNSEIYLSNLNISSELSLFLSKKYNLIYLCQVMYSLKENKCIELLSTLLKILNKDGTLIIIHYPYKKNFIRYIKSKISNNMPKSIFDFFGKDYIQKTKKQFWGYERTDSFYIKIANKLSLKLKNKFHIDGQSFLFFQM